jgi:hypothetical protein
MMNWEGFKRKRKDLLQAVSIRLMGLRKTTKTFSHEPMPSPPEYGLAVTIGGNAFIVPYFIGMKQRQCTVSAMETHFKGKEQTSLCFN